VLSAVIDRLTCPICTENVLIEGGSVRCLAGHSFDIARQGYVNLLPGGARAGTADTAEMVRARTAFLGAGHYAALSGRLRQIAQPHLGPGSCVVDAGAGTGHYLSEVLAGAPEAVGLALDISKYALRHAARLPRVGAAVCDVWAPFPVREGAADVVLNVFAPRNPAEFHRVLRPDGVLIVVTPGADHLGELVGPLGLLTVDERKGDRVAEAFKTSFDLVDAEDQVVDMRLTREEAAALIGMGPSAHHIDAAELAARLAPLAEPVQAMAAFTISVLRRRP